VIAYGAGGALETLVEGVSGLFFREPTAESLAEAVTRLDSVDFDPAVIRENAQRYSRAAFQSRFAEFVRKKCAEFCGS
jgi:glycosyltransferase involved in cell wall biosynthesis